MPSTRTSFEVWNHILTDQGTGSGGVPDFQALYGMPRLCEVNNDQIGIANTTGDPQTTGGNATNQAIVPPSSGTANASIAGIKALSRYQGPNVFYDVEGTWTQGGDLYAWNNTDGHVQTTLSGSGITNANQNVDTANKWNTVTSLMRAAWTADGEPGAIHGVYGITGGNSNYAYQSAYATNWRAGNDAMVAGGMLAHIDFLAPSMYKSFDNMASWDAMFAAYMTEADRMRVAAGFPNMPIYAFLQPEVDNTDGSQTQGDYMTGSQFRHQLDACFANPLCWGVVLWHEPVWPQSGVWGDSNNNVTSGWFSQVLAWMQANALGVYAPSGGTIPSAASGVSVTAITSSTATVSWTNNGTGQVDNLIEIETPSGSADFVSYGTAAGGATSKTVTGLPAGASLKASVTARGSGGNAARALSSAFDTLASTTSAEGEEVMALGVASQSSIDGLQPAPTAFPSGAQWTAQHVARLAGGGVQTDSTDYGFCAIDTDDTGQEHEFRFGSSVSDGTSSIADATVMTANFGGTTIGNTPDSGSGSNGYSIEARRNTSADPWNIRLLVNAGPAPSTALQAELTAYSSTITGMIFKTKMLSAGPQVVATPNTGVAKTYTGTDSAWRGTIAGSVDRTPTGTPPKREMRFNVAAAPSSATINPNDPTAGGQAIEATGTITPPTVAGTVSISLVLNGTEQPGAVTATVNQSTGAYSATLIATQPGVYKARVRIGSGQPVDSTGTITMLSISGLVQA